jgi:hypothetical protein
VLNAGIKTAIEDSVALHDRSKKAGLQLNVTRRCSQPLGTTLNSRKEGITTVGPIISDALLDFADF